MKSPVLNCFLAYTGGSRLVMASRIISIDIILNLMIFCHQLASPVYARNWFCETRCMLLVAVGGCWCAAQTRPSASPNCGEVRLDSVDASESSCHFTTVPCLVNINLNCQSQSSCNGLIFRSSAANSSQQCVRQMSAQQEPMRPLPPMLSLHPSEC